MTTHILKCSQCKNKLEQIALTTPITSCLYKIYNKETSSWGYLYIDLMCDKNMLDINEKLIKLLKQPTTKLRIRCPHCYKLLDLSFKSIHDDGNLLLATLEEDEEDYL